MFVGWSQISSFSAHLVHGLGLHFPLAHLLFHMLGSDYPLLYGLSNQDCAKHVYYPADGSAV